MKEAAAQLFELLDDYGDLDDGDRESLRDFISAGDPISYGNAVSIGYVLGPALTRFIDWISHLSGDGRAAAAAALSALVDHISETGGVDVRALTDTFSGASPLSLKSQVVDGIPACPDCGPSMKVRKDGSYLCLHCGRETTTPPPDPWRTE